MKISRFHKKTVIPVFIIIFVLCAAVAVSASDTYIDIQGHWAEEHIERMHDKEIVKGYDDGSFRPDTSVTRAEFMTMVNRAKDFEDEAVIDFLDVEEEAWYYDEIARAVEAGYIKGDADGNMNPDKEINRQEVAVILFRLLELEEIEDKSAVDSFEDSSDIASWSMEEVNAVVSSEYMGGYPDSTFKPLDGITRAETVVVLERALGEPVNEDPIDEDPIVEPDNSYVNFEDQGDGTAIVTLVVRDSEDNGITSFGMDDIEVKSKLAEEWGSLTIINEDPNITISDFTCDGDGTYTYRIARPFETVILSFRVDGVVIEEDLEAVITQSVDADNSSATAADNEDGSAQVTLDVQDQFGNGISGFTMDDVELSMDQEIWATLTEIDDNPDQAEILDFTDHEDGTYTYRVIREDGERIVSLRVDGVIIESELSIEVTGTEN